MYYKVKAFLHIVLQDFLFTLQRNDIKVTQKVFEYNDNNFIIENEKSLCKQDKSAQDIISIDVLLEHPKDKSHGHFATPISFTLAKILRKSPIVIATEFANFLQERNTLQYNEKTNSYLITTKVCEDSHTEEIPMFESIEVINGYINMRISDVFLVKQADLALQNPHNFAKGRKKDYSILLEYVSANPTGPLHIGHARGAIFGSVLQNIGKYLGYTIIGEYYVNDAGSQIDMLALSVYNRIATQLQLPQKDGEVYKGEYINEIANAALQHFSKDFFSQHDDAKILSDLGLFAKDLMLQEIKNNLSALNITFDNFVSEKALYSHWDKVLAQLEAHHALLHKDNAIWLHSSIKGDEKDRVLVRENNLPTYMAGDIIYHQDKFQRNYDHYINIWGADHHGYIARIKASIEFLGFDSTKLEVLLAQMVSLLKGGQPYKMSKRAGNFILIQDVINDIGADNLKFIFLTKSLDTHLEFDLEDLSKEDSSNPVFYINYANARIHTLIEKSHFTRSEILNYPIDNLIAHLDGRMDKAMKEDCMLLMLQSLGLFYTLNQSYDERALQKLCDFLRSLAKSLHTFYNAHKIIGSSCEKAVLKILLMVSLSLSTGFQMLGIEIKTTM